MRTGRALTWEEGSVLDALRYLYKAHVEWATTEDISDFFRRTGWDHSYAVIRKACKGLAEEGVIEMRKGRYAWWNYRLVEKYR